MINQRDSESQTSSKTKNPKKQDCGPVRLEINRSTRTNIRRTCAVSGERGNTVRMSYCWAQHYSYLEGLVMRTTRSVMAVRLRALAVWGNSLAGSGVYPELCMWRNEKTEPRPRAFLQELTILLTNQDGGVARSTRTHLLGHAWQIAL